MSKPAPLVALSVILALALAPAPARAQTVDDLLDDLLLSSPAVGEKNNARSLAPMRLGWGFWSMGDPRGGYLNLVSQTALEPPCNDPGDPALLADQPCVSWTPMGEDPFVGPVTCDEGSATDGIWESMFLNAHARFDAPGPGGDGDLGAAFDGTGLDLFVAQGTVFSPVRDPAVPFSCSFGGPPGGPPLGIVPAASYKPYAFRTWYGATAPAAAARGLRIIDNIGFGNHPTLAGNDFDLSLNHPIRLRPPEPPDLSSGALPRLAKDTPLGFVLGYQRCVIEDPAHNPILNPVHPAIAALVRESIEASVTAMQPYAAQIDHTITNGEFFVSVGSNEYDTAISFPVPCIIPGGPFTGLASFDDYYDSLPASDYSNASLAHFRAWLARRHPAGVGDLETAWELPPGTFADFADVHPLDEGTLAVADWDAVRHDWVAFQREQWIVEAHGDQYHAAKALQPDRAFYRLDYREMGGEPGCYYADGPASATFLNKTYAAGEALGPLTFTETKLEVLRSVTFGESMSLPLLGFPRSDFGEGTLVSRPLDGETEVPTSYEPSSYNADHSYRTLREAIALGVDALGIAYWEVSTFFSLKNAFFPAVHPLPDLPAGQQPIAPPGARLPEAMDRLHDLFRDARTFMTPWRSPLLVHAGRAPVPGEKGALANIALPWRVLDELAADQIQAAPFTLHEARNDLWVGQGRQALLSAFAPELDQVLFDDQVAWSTEIGLSLVTVLAEEDTLDVNWPGWDGDLVAAGYVLTAGSPADTWEKTGTPTVRVLAYAPGSTTTEILDDVRARLDADAPGFLGVVERTLRPVLARPVAGGPAATTLDVTVSHDGLSWLVCVANTDPDTDSSDTEVVVAASGPTGASYAAVPIGVLGGGDSRLVHVLPDLPALDALSDDVLLDAVDAAEAQLAALPAGFDVSAAEVAQETLEGVLGEPPATPLSGLQRQKIVAALLRLERMPFVRVSDPVGGAVEVRRLDASPYPGAEVQLEFVLQHHARRAAPATDAAGVSDFDPSPPCDAPVWDVVAQQYVLPERNLVEIAVHDPAHHGHVSLLAEFDPAVCP